MFLLDTNTVSYLIRNDFASLRRNLNSRTISLVRISVITQAELLYGLARKPGASSLRSKVESFLSHVECLPWQSETAMSYASLRTLSEAQGISIGNLDLLIAAHAHATDSTLVTHDGALHRLEPWLKVVDWVEP